MKLHWCRLALLVCGVLPLPRVHADDSLHRVQRLELAGKNEERASALEELKQLAPNAPQTHWLSGEIRVGNDWVPYTKVADHGDRWAELHRYREERAKRTDSAEDQYFLADGCRKHKLTDEERAHLYGVVSKTPDDQEAHQRLGDVYIGGVWVTAAQAAQAERQIRENQAAYKKWGKQLQLTKENLTGTSNKRRVTGQETLNQLRDFAAIRVMEELLAPGAEQEQLTFKNWLSHLDSWKASSALARLAVRSESAKVRLECVSELKKRRLEEYVPTVLSTMVSPIDVGGARVQFGPWVFYDQQAVVETANRKYVFHYTARFGPEFYRLQVNSSTVTVDRLGGPAKLNKVGDRIFSSFSESEATEAAIQNSVSQAWCDRCTRILSDSSGQTGLESANDWWAWWNDDQGYFVIEKEQVFAQYQEDWYISRRRQRLRRDTRFDTQRVLPSASGSCFAADTPVQTEYGLKPIAEIERGDRVLSQDVETGELAFKPVLRTTKRVSPGSAIVSCGEDKLHCTPGHPFWVNGLGWRMADELEPGARFHSLNGAVDVKAIDTAEKLEVYNLEVADFSTYFVGKSQVLTHDVTIRQPTDTLVPGLAKTVATVP